MKGILLCVDDELMVLNALKDQLKNRYGEQHIIELAESAEEGLEILEELQNEGLIPLVIISDWLMPGMKGDEFLIEAHKRYPYVVKILLSGQVDSEAIQRSKTSANLHDFFDKPWSATELIASIDRGLDEYMLITAQLSLPSRVNN